MRWVFCAAVLLAVVGQAQAAGYDDFTTALSANVRNEPDIAIAAFSAALKSGDLVPAYVAASHRGRAQAYFYKKQCAEALADLKTYASLRPLEPEAVLLRARVKMCLGDGPGAQEDWQAFAGADPRAGDYWVFARMLWSNGLFEEAHQNMLKAVEKMETRDSDATYIALWYAMAAERVGKPDAAKLEGILKSLGREWPVALLNFYLGKLTRDDVKYKADSWLPDKARRQTCEADYYVAEWLIAHRDVETAKTLLASAYEKCPKDFLEYGAAQDEMRRLGMPVKEDTP